MSSLPMVAFGNTPNATGATVDGGFTAENRVEGTNFTVRVPMNSFWQMFSTEFTGSPAGTLRMIMELEHARVVDSLIEQMGPNRNIAVRLDTILVDPRVSAGVAPTTSSALGASINVYLTAVEGSQAVLEFRWSDMSAAGMAQLANIRGIQGSVDFTIRLRGYGDNWVYATLNLAGQTFGENMLTLINRWNLVWRHAGRINITRVGNPRGFTNALLLPHIRISETLFGTITNNGTRTQATVRLEAPRFYSWSFQAPAGVTLTGDTLTVGRPATVIPLEVGRSGSLSTATINNIHVVRPTGTEDTHVLYITVSITEAAHLNPLTGWFELRNLWLTPDYHAPAAGNVNINVAVGQWRGAVGATGPIASTPDRWVNQYAMETVQVPTGVNQQRRTDSTIVLIGGVEHILLTAAGTTGSGALVNLPATRNFLHSAPLGTGPANVFHWIIEGDTSVPVPRQMPPASFTMVGDVPTAPAGSNLVATYVSVAAPHMMPTAHSRTQPVEPRVVIGQTFIPGTPGTAGSAGWAAGIYPIWAYVNDLHVGTRGAASLSIDVYNMQEMRTGHLGNWRGANSTQSLPGNVPPNRDNALLGHYSGVMTGTVVISEDVPGAFSVGFGTGIHFDFLDENGSAHPGIRILGMQARAGNDGTFTAAWYNNIGSFNNFHAGTQAFYGNNRNQNWMTFAGWMSQLDQRLPVVPGVGRLSDHRGTLYLPSQTIDDIRTPATLEVRFFLSLEAGYEWKYGEAVNVTVSGPGIHNLNNGQPYTVQIGEAVDPIRANITALDFEHAAIETGTLYNIVGRTPIEDIVIELQNPNAFQIGDELWIYATSDVLARSFDLNLVGIPRITVEGNNTLQFSFGHLLNPQVGRVGREGVAFAVTRSANSQPATIRISGLYVEGQAFPGVEYKIVLSGTAIANNDQEVFHASNRNAAFGTAIASMNRGIFTSLPYFGTAVVNDGTGGGGQGGITAPPAGRELRLWEGMGALAGVPEIDIPFFWEIVGPNRVGMVSLRAFAEYFLLESNVSWNAPDGSISGLDSMGRPVTISFTTGNTNANVIRDGVTETFDIATSVDFLSGPRGTVAPLFRYNRAYLPLRFVTETFGFAVEMVGNTVIVR